MNLQQSCLKFSQQHNKETYKMAKKRGSHPYYCPNGWQKYALMVPHHESAKVCLSKPNIIIFLLLKGI